MSHVANSSPDPIDIAVGARVRMRRKALGITQSNLAEALGLTFQQIQKYERGTNRISASMLVRAAHRLECSVSFLVGEEAGGYPTDNALMVMLAFPGAIDMLKAYTAIDSSEARAAVLSLARSLAEGAGSKAA